MQMGSQPLTLAIALILAVPTPAWCQQEQEKPAAQQPSTCKDKTGIRWVLPFPKALAEAQRTNRLLLLKPIAFGTEKSGGW